MSRLATASQIDTLGHVFCKLKPLILSVNIDISGLRECLKSEARDSAQYLNEILSESEKKKLSTIESELKKCEKLIRLLKEEVPPSMGKIRDFVGKMGKMGGAGLTVKKLLETEKQYFGEKSFSDFTHELSTKFTELLASP